MVVMVASCNQKGKETTIVNAAADSSEVSVTNDSIAPDSKTVALVYACPMHPEVQGKLNDECPKCGMKLTESVPEKTE